MRHRWKVFYSFIFVLSLLFPLVPERSDAAAYSATVAQVVDGDTIHLTESVLGTTKVRLLSIDAPETNYNGQAQNPWGTNAKNYLAQLLPPGTRITIETDVEEKDAYGRLLAHVWKGTLDVNKEMVRQGHAVTYYIWPNMKYFEDYQSAYLEARQAGRGMWNPSNPIPELPFEFRDRVSGSSQDKYVGDYYTKKYVDPADYKQIPIENRVFFFTEADAQSAGYSKEGGGQPPAGLYINEVLPAPQSRYTQEFVEIYNAGSSSVDLSGYVIDDITGGGSAPYTIPSGTVIPAKGYFVWETNNYFNNAGDTVTLKARDGTVLDQYSYSGTAYDASWYRKPDGGTWSSQQDTTPTKGAANY
ncbi:thermonuclease family protein [Lihuaxuella thermophila]|uniref:Endonuclease YncB, thermonuclease family n=1 Tax=Lihuaxuella thermophila TaxID=1173111 RepID=A0A1H8H3L0_9BACL|nr:thermonuclease family protein [Lihuaxuella thermophila]SEN50327.1 Endonuclease YncB, thermonuclease family [Lihuaxuella thermophila]